MEKFSVYQFFQPTTKIEITDSVQDIIIKMSEDNPGALTVCIQILKQNKEIDPDALMEGVGTLLSLDTLGIYGSKIWMFYKDVCNRNLSIMLCLLRSWQLGFTTDIQIRHAINNYGKGLDIPVICAKVIEQLPNFKVEVRRA